MKKNRSDIFRDKKTGEVVVVDENGVEIFRREYSKEIVGIANCIYLAHKYQHKKQQ